MAKKRKSLSEVLEAETKVESAVLPDLPEVPADEAVESVSTEVIEEVVPEVEQPEGEVVGLEPVEVAPESVPEDLDSKIDGLSEEAPVVEPEVFQEEVSSAPVEAQKYFGSSRLKVLSMCKKSINGREYTELLCEDRATYLLTNEELSLQLVF